MDRINVYSYPAEDDSFTGRTLAGWFDLDKAELFREDTYFDGSNEISVNTGSQWAHQVVYRTANGRWVLHGYGYSNRQGSGETYEFLSNEEAELWLIRNHADEAAARFFGQIEEERGPGRPGIGKPINVRLGDLMLSAVDAHAKERGTTRVKLIRRLVGEGLVREGVITETEFINCYADQSLGAEA